MEKRMVVGRGVVLVRRFLLERPTFTQAATERKNQGTADPKIHKEDLWVSLLNTKMGMKKTG